VERHPAEPTAAGRYMPGLAALQREGGDVIPSFGGYSADHAVTEIADSCPSVRRLARAYESVVRTYGATRLDMDVEDRSLEHRIGIDCRNRALRLVERWARRHGRRLQISYTLPVAPAGREAGGLAVLRDARRTGTRVDVVNIMTFGYYDGVTTDMGGAAISAAAIQRDNGACPGRIDSNSCSGIVQLPWAFAHLLEPFTSRAS
jgi:Glycosyl hydrolases family 18